MQHEVIEQPEREGVLESALSSHRRLRLKNILVPTDFSNESVKAVRYGVALSQQFEGVLWLLHVIEPAPAFAGFEGIPSVMDQEHEAAKAEAQMAEFAAKHIPPGVAVTSIVRHGSTVGEISALAKARDLDLVLISTHGRTGFSRAVYGSMAERILHHAPCPILIVREDENEFVEDSPALEIHLHRILVPLDFTECSRKALKYAEALAWKFNATLHCVHLLEPEKPLIVVETESFRKAGEDGAGAKMAAELKAIDPALHVETTIQPGDPHCKIVELAGERQINLIILGEHSRSGTRRFLMGSTIDEVLKHARCPTLVVREIEHEFVE